jgi:hypothetical protein
MEVSARWMENENCSRLVSGGGAIVIVWKVEGID